jgi:hypothetical protein
MAALVFLGTTAAASPSAGAGITAEQAMANYRAVLNGAMAGTDVAAPCPPGAGGEIVVCHREIHPPPRLPMPEARAEPGEVVHHLGEPARPDAGPPATPSRLGETLAKGIHLLKSAVTGEDPTD